MSRPKSKFPRKRRGLAPPEKVVEEWEDLRDMTQADSLHELLRRSGEIYRKFLVALSRPGVKVIIRDDEGEREVIIPESVWYNLSLAKQRAAQT